MRRGLVVCSIAAVPGVVVLGALWTPAFLLDVRVLPGVAPGVLDVAASA